MVVAEEVGEGGVVGCEVVIQEVPIFRTVRMVAMEVEDMHKLLMVVSTCEFLLMHTYFV